MARRHADPADFALLGVDGDPAPGDPERIDQLRRRYLDIGDAAERAHAILRQGGAVQAGRGAAMEKLTATISDDLPTKLATTARSYHDAAKAYATYGPRLQEAQDQVDRAVEQARAVATTAGQTVPDLPADATDRRRGEVDQLRRQVDEAKDGLASASALAEQARASREDAQRSLERDLDGAAAEAIAPRDFLELVADAFDDFPLEIVLGVLVGIVSVFFPVVGAILGAALGAVSFLTKTLPDLVENGFSLDKLVTGLVGIALGAAGGALLGGAAKVGAKFLPDLLGGLNRGHGSIGDALRAGPGRGRGTGEDADGTELRTLDGRSAGRSTGADRAGDGPASRTRGAIARELGFGRTPDSRLDLDLVPENLRRSGSTRTFKDAAFPDLDFEVVTTHGSNLPVFRVQQTGQHVIADHSFGFREVPRTGGLDAGSAASAPRVDPLQPLRQPVRDGAFPVKGSIRQDFAQSSTPFRLPPGEVRLVPKDMFGPVRGDPGQPPLDESRLRDAQDGITRGHGLDPIKVSRDGDLLDGNHRLAAARGDPSITQVPTITT